MTKRVKKKTLDITNIKGAKLNIKDIKVFGNGDLFELICKASSEDQGWMKSTKGMTVRSEQFGALGTVVQVTTQQRNPDGTYALAEALTYVPGASILTDKDGNKYLGYVLVGEK